MRQMTPMNRSGLPGNGGTRCFYTTNNANNPFTIGRIRHTVEEAGNICPEIVSPEAFLGEET